MHARGTPVGVYRQAGQHAPTLAAYTFTGFPDELTDLSYRSREWFIHAIGRFRA